MGFNQRAKSSENLANSSEVIELLATSSNPEIRLAAAGNPAISSALLEKLVNEECDYVRLHIAAISHLQQDLLQKLANDRNPEVAAAARRTLESLMRPDSGRFDKTVQKLTALKLPESF